MKSKQVKQSEAYERQSAREVLTAQRQLIALDERLGVGVGADRERKRLLAIIWKAR